MTLDCTTESYLLEPLVTFLPFISSFQITFENVTVNRSHFPAGYSLKVK